MMNQAKILETIAWPLSRLGEGIHAIAGKQNAITNHFPEMADANEKINKEMLQRWLDTIAGQIDMELEPVSSNYGNLENCIRNIAPGLISLSPKTFLLVVKSGQRNVTALGPDLKRHQLPVEAIRTALSRELEAPVEGEIHDLLCAANLSQKQQAATRKVLLKEKLAAEPIQTGWLLQESPGSSFWQQLQSAKISNAFLRLIAAHFAEYTLWILSWWLIGKSALQGNLDTGWTSAWVLLIITLVFARLSVTWLMGRVSIEGGALLKKRLLAGVLKLSPEEIRHEGIGRLLGRSIEAETLENLGMSGGILALIASIELVLAAVILAFNSYFALLLLVAWTAVTILFGWQNYRRSQEWTNSRMEITGDLVENMAGHRTRQVQQKPALRHQDEDRGLRNYLTLSEQMDRTLAKLMAVIPRGWLALGMIAIAPVFAAGNSNAMILGALFGGIILAFRAFKRLAFGMSHLAGAAVAWEQIMPLFRAANRPVQFAAPAAISVHSEKVSSKKDTAVLLDAAGIRFTYGDGARQILQGCDLQIHKGDRLLLTGESGGGKSTLAAILSGLRQPQSGLLLFRGLDAKTLGDKGWREQMASAPQFHENYVLTGTFAFNLLMGRNWPPQPEDLEAAEAICRELGLGDLLDRMPSGLFQMVGESGWQLSHGEKSRLFVARALLQNAEIVILDESFAALDPENFQQTMATALKHSETLMVIAHP